jgi:branched-chain amino acid transport system ATP-binding protein
MTSSRPLTLLEPDAGLAPPALELDSVSASYGPYLALFDVSFSVLAGAVVALLGSNGVGKSTVSRVATGLLPSSSGVVRIKGVTVTERPAFRIARMGVAHVPEGRAIFSKLTVEENLSLAFRQRLGRALASGALGRAYDTYPILKERRTHLAGTLSGGQQRILSLAKVLVAPPALLIADELCLGLAPLVVDMVYEGLREMNRAGASLLIVEQQIDRVLDIADRAVVLDHGAVAFDGVASGAAEAVERVLTSRGEQPVLITGNHPDHPIVPDSRFGLPADARGTRGRRWLWRGLPG